LALWTGIIVVIESADVKSTSKTSIISKTKKTIISITIAVFVFIFVAAKPTTFQLLHFILTCIGVYVSYLIVQHELGLHSKILDTFCSEQHKKTNCNAVLSSKGATVFGLFKLSDVGLVYFASLALTWILIAFNGWQSTSIFLFISSIAILFTFFSIYYQYKIVKSWCPLCLTVVGLLWLQFGTLFFNNTPLKNLFVVDKSYLIFTTSVLIVITFWILMLPLLKKEQLFKKLKIEHTKFKRNFTLFKAALNLNKTINTSIKGVNELIFGDKLENAPLKLTLITNPMCGFCKESHTIVERILQQESAEIQITIRFNVRVDDREAIGTKIAAKILELYHTTTEKECLQALSDIYGDVNAETWLSKWGETFNEDYFTILKNEKEWCTANKINFTPAILLNGKQYPTAYNIKDLLFFLDDLIEEQTIAKEELIEIE
jgi:uncharacterized membrane protein